MAIVGFFIQHVFTKQYWNADSKKFVKDVMNGSAYFEESTALRHAVVMSTYVEVTPISRFYFSYVCDARYN